jgi:hypothetical protein
VKICWSVRETVVAALLLSATARAQELRLPLKPDSVRFAVIGDTGTASTPQYDVGRQMAAFHERFPFAFVIMAGDNIYGSDGGQDFRNKFELPYRGLLDAGVVFHASLGNHDNPTQSLYKLFNMDGHRFYTFKPGPAVRFFALDSNYMDKSQLTWVEKELAASGADWKVCFFHHPLYSSARTHGSSLDLRASLEPIFTKYKVDLVFNGHDHTYERIKPQQGIQYFVVGSSGSLRKGDLRRSELTAAGFDQDFTFFLAEIAGDDFYFQAVSRTGQTVDSGVVHRPPSETGNTPPSSLSPAPGAPPLTPAPVGPSPGAAAPPGSALSPAPTTAPPPRPTPTKKAVRGKRRRRS